MKNFLTAEEFKELAARRPYYKTRWDYISNTIDILKITQAQKILEIGVGQEDKLCKSSVSLGISLTFKSDIFLDVTQSALPFYDKQFDCVVALEVFEHLGTSQPKAFEEIRRVSHAAILSFPYCWECPKDPIHNAIGYEIIDGWTKHRRPESIRHVGSRVIYYFNFDLAV